MFVVANIAEAPAQFFTIDRKLSSAVGASCFQADIAKALHFARKEDAEKFAEAYYPFMSLNAQAHAL